MHYCHSICILCIAVWPDDLPDSCLPIVGLQMPLKTWWPRSCSLFHTSMSWGRGFSISWSTSQWSHVALAARIVMSSFFCQSPNIKFAKFYTEAFQAISPNLMATKMSQYTVWPLNMNCIIGARYGSLKVMAAFSERFLRTNSSTNNHKWQWADTEDSSVLIKYVILRCIMHNWE